jgi:hypothetical protein
MRIPGSAMQKVIVAKPTRTRSGPQQPVGKAPHTPAIFLSFDYEACAVRPS